MIMPIKQKLVCKSKRDTCPVWTSDDQEIPTDQSHILNFTVPATNLLSASARSTPDTSPTLSRQGRFVLLDDALPDFSSYRLFICPLTKSENDGTNHQASALRTLLEIGGSGDITDFYSKRIKLSDETPSLINALGLKTMTLRQDGSFNILTDIEGNEVGWAWMLLGPERFIGYQLDAVPTLPRRSVTIVLPLSNDETSDDLGENNGASDSSPSMVSSENNRASDSSPSKVSSTAPMNVDEKYLIDNPEQFGEDPGTACNMFTTPSRILGERRFSTILRIDQPEITGRNTTAVSRPPLVMMPISPGFIYPRPIDPRPELRPRVPFVTRMLSRVSRPLFARNSTRFLGWNNWVAKRSKGRVQVSSKDPIEWEGDPTIYQATTVAGGHVLDWKVQWRADGYSLGDIAHTLTLAPRQTRRVATISWERMERARRSEQLETADRLRQSTSRQRDYTDAVQSSLSEWSRGGSKSSTFGAAGGIGFALGPVVIGGGAAGGTAASSSWQKGGRRAAAREEQQLRDAIRQYGDSLRTLESSVVVEVSQEEEATGVVETLRNINYCHALTVVYHQILRHLRVDTSFDSVRECLFVPLSISPFDYDKVLKWRDLLRFGMMDKSLAWALNHLDEVKSRWEDSDIPDERRADFPLKHVTGSIYIDLSIERPREPEEKEALDVYYNLWSPYSSFFALPMRKIVARMLELNQALRDDYFQEEVAPTMAAKWANQLSLKAGTQPLANVDFTLASSYSYGKTVRVDFSVAGDDKGNVLTRSDLETLFVETTKGLPPGSVANVKFMKFRYRTKYFSRKVRSERTVDDLIMAGSGDPTIEGARISAPLSPWEEINERAFIQDAVDRLVVHLNSNIVYYHKVIWWLMDRDELYMLLDGFYVPYGRRFENGKWIDDRGRSLASVVEREPLAILGNTIVFRVAAGVFLGIDDHDSPEAVHNYYFDSQAVSEPLRASLPTDGLYAQAVIDKRCEACEEHEGSTDWVLTNNEPELEAIVGQLSSRRSAAEALSPTKLPDTIISLQNAPNAPDPSGLSGALQAVTKGDSFRDMAGLAGTQANALGAMNTAANLAQGFGGMAVDLEKARLGTSSAKKKLDNIKKAEKEGLIGHTEAVDQASRALNEQNMSPSPGPVTEDLSVSKSLQRAAEFGTPMEVQRVDQGGAEYVKVGHQVDFTTFSITLDTSTYSASCVCGKAYANNCAHYLSNWMIKERLIRPRPPGSSPGGRCSKGRPIRAKEMRNVFESMGLKRTFNEPGKECFIYCERRSDHQGHVYYGRKNVCKAGTGDGSFGADYYEYYVPKGPTPPTTSPTPTPAPTPAPTSPPNPNVG